VDVRMVASHGVLLVTISRAGTRMWTRVGDQLQWTMGRSRIANALPFDGQAHAGGVRGSHIVVPRFPGSPNAAVYTEAVDGRRFLYFRGTIRYGRDDGGCRQRRFQEDSAVGG